MEISNHISVFKELDPEKPEDAKAAEDFRKMYSEMDEMSKWSWDEADDKFQKWKAQFTKKQLTPTKRKAARKRQKQARKAGRR